MQLEDLQPRCAVRGVHPDGLVTVVSVQWFGSEALELTYKTQAGAVANELLYRHDETRLEVVAQGRPWSFDGDGALFRLVSEAQRIRLAHLFDPLLAIHTSVVDPLPHQIVHRLPRSHAPTPTRGWSGPVTSHSRPTSRGTQSRETSGARRPGRPTSGVHVPPCEPSRMPSARLSRTAWLACWTLPPGRCA